MRLNLLEIVCRLQFTQSAYCSFEGSWEKICCKNWAGIVGDYLLGSYIMPPRLSWPMYRLFLEVHLPTLLEDVPLHIRRRMWFQLDGGPSHFAYPVRVVINNTFGNRWIGRGGHVNWPTWSPDLTPLNLFLWGYMKTQVYSSPVESEMEVVVRILAATQTYRIRHTFSSGQETLYYIGTGSATR